MRRTTVTLTALAAVLAAGMGFLLIPQDRPGNDRETETSTTTDAAAAARSGEDRDQVVVARGIEAATGSQRWLYMTDVEIEADLTRITAPNALERVTEEVLDGVGESRTRLSVSSGRVWWLVRPLAWDLDWRADTEVRVRVWVVTVLSAAEVAAPQADWATVTVDLEQIGGEWLLVDMVMSAGPTPMAGLQDAPWDAVPFDRALEGFTRVDGEPLW